MANCGSRSAIIQSAIFFGGLSRNLTLGVLLAGALLVVSANAENSRDGIVPDIGGLAQAPVEQESVTPNAEVPSAAAATAPANANAPTKTLRSANNPPQKINFKAMIAGASAPNSRIRLVTAKYLGEEPDSKVVDLVVAQLQKRRPKTIDTYKLKKSSPAVVRHLRGKGPVTFPETSEVLAALRQYHIEPKQVFEKPEYQQALAQYKTSVKQAKSIIETPPDLPSCPNDLVKALKLADAGEVLPVKVDEHVEFDWLFVRNKAPGDVQEVFGKDTVVHVYSTNPKDQISLMAAKQGIECLPYRVRMGTKYAVHMMGLPALKNYDTKRNGVLYEGIKARIRDFR